MTPNGITCILVTVAALLAAPSIPLAQDAITAPAQKTVGSAKAKIEPSADRHERSRRISAGRQANAKRRVAEFDHVR